MTTRFILAALQFFGVTAIVSIAIALVAPLDASRFLGVVALACAGSGFLIHLHALRRMDPQAFMTLSARVHAMMQNAWRACSRVASLLGGASRPASWR